MARIGVWKVPAGALFVTPDAIGFGFYQEEELGKLRADLENGLGANRAAGFSGDVYPLKSIRRIQVIERKKRVVVEFRDLMFTGKNDINFPTEAACREFCELVLENLGRDWERGTVPDRSVWKTVLAVVVIFIATAMVGTVGTFMLAGPSPAKSNAKVGGPSEWLCVGMAFFATIASIAWVVYHVKRPRMIDAIQPRKNPAK
jgi:hypothetical protein